MHILSIISTTDLFYDMPILFGFLFCIINAIFIQFPFVHINPLSHCIARIYQHTNKYDCTAAQQRLSADLCHSSCLT